MTSYCFTDDFSNMQPSKSLKAAWRRPRRSECLSELLGNWKPSWSSLSPCLCLCLSDSSYVRPSHSSSLSAALVTSYSMKSRHEEERTCRETLKVKSLFFHHSCWIFSIFDRIFCPLRKNFVKITFLPIQAPGAIYHALLCALGNGWPWLEINLLLPVSFTSPTSLPTSLL